MFVCLFVLAPSLLACTMAKGVHQCSHVHGARQVSLPSTSFATVCARSKCRNEKHTGSRVSNRFLRGRQGRQRFSIQLGALKVSFQGVHGAYSEQAARKAYPDAEVVPCSDFETTHKQVQNLSVDRAVIPVENSLGQSLPLPTYPSIYLIL